MLAGFMEQKNILWGELVGGVLIVGCSIALVISLWRQLEAIPYFPFLGFTAITGALYASAVRYGYGELWFRPGLVHRQRMLVAIASFTVLGLDAQLRKFAQSAVNIGLPRNEIIEAVIQTAPYGGFPRALNGLTILSEVLPEAA